MNQKECFERLGFTERQGDPSVEMTIGSLVSAIVQSIDSRLADSADEIDEFKPCLFDSEYFLLKRGDELMFVSSGGTSGSSYLYVSSYASELFSALRDDHRLHEILDQAIIVELRHLSVQEAGDREAKAKERRRAEFEKLKLEFEPSLTSATTDPIVVAGVSSERADA